MTREQWTTSITLVVTVAVQSIASYTRADLLALVLPAFGLGIATAVLTLQSASLLHSLRPKRTLLAAMSLGLVALCASTLLIDSPKSDLLMLFSRMIVLDCAFLGLGRACASFIAGGRPARG
jgi:hypothetical protein